MSHYLSGLKEKEQFNREALRLCATPVKSISLAFRTIFLIQGNSARLHSNLHMKIFWSAASNDTIFVCKYNLFKV